MDSVDKNYSFIKDERAIVKKIESLVELSQCEARKIYELYDEDLYFLSIIDKSLKLIDSFLFALKYRNITVLAIFTRVQIDCALRAYAVSLVNNSGEFCNKVLIKKAQINKEKDRNNNYLTDKFLCESLGNYLKLPIYDLYKKVCGYVHFSSDSFYNSVKTVGENGLEMCISKDNLDRDPDVYDRLSIELANHFFYFGKLLSTLFLKSWNMQKEAMANKEKITDSN